MTSQIELPFEGDPLYNQILPLPPQVRGLIFTVAQIRGESFSPVKTLQRLYSLPETGMCNEETCTYIQNMLNLSNAVDVLKDMVGVLLDEEKSDVNIRKILQFKYEKELTKCLI